MLSPAITIATPTYRREHLLRHQLQTVLSQSEQNFEWLILDDSPEPSDYFRNLADTRIRYHHIIGPRMTIGAKRNWLASQAKAPVIAHFDDDDYYAPEYLATMLAQLARNDAGIVKLSAWFVYAIAHRLLGYWNTVQTQGLHFRVSSQNPIIPIMLNEEQSKAFETHYAGFGYTYVYRKSVWEHTAFPEADFNEDYGFVRSATQKGVRFSHFSDTEGLCLQIMQPDGISVAFPQFLFPRFMLGKIFPRVVDRISLA